MCEMFPSGRMPDDFPTITKIPFSSPSCCLTKRFLKLELRTVIKWRLGTFVSLVYLLSLVIFFSAVKFCKIQDLFDYSVLNAKSEI